MSDCIIVEDREAVRIIRMNRPDKLNALNTELTQALLDGLAAADAAASVRAVVLAGEGQGFCAGADLAEFKDLTPEHQHRVLARADLTCRLQSKMQEMTKPVVSAVHGVAIGGGAGLAIGCDMMVAGADIRFGYPELKHDIVPALVMTGLQRQLGRKAAFEMVSLGRLIGAAEARARGRAHRVCRRRRWSTPRSIAGRWAAATRWRWRPPRRCSTGPDRPAPPWPPAASMR